MSKDDEQEVIDAVANDVKGAVKKEEDKLKGTWDKAKDFANSLAFWKKDLTDEEKLAKAQKKIAKAEKKYQKAMEKAAKEKDEEKAAAIKAKADKKYNKSVSKVAEKYPEQVAQIRANPQLLADEMAKESAWTKTWNKAKKTANSLAFWKKDLTPEKEYEKANKKLEKIEKKYTKAMEKAAKEKDEEKAAAIRAKAKEDFDKSIGKLNKKYPNGMGRITSEAAQIEAENQKALAEAAAKKREAEQKAAEAANQKALAEETSKGVSKENDAPVASAEATPVNSENDDTQKRFEDHVEKKETAKKAKARVSNSPKRSKLEIMEDWMEKVNLSKEDAKKMVDKYGMDMAYKLTQRCMLEPDKLMPEVDEKFKKVQNKSGTSIKYFLDLDTTKEANRNAVSKATGMEFTNKEVAYLGGSSKSNRFIVSPNERT